MPPRSPFPLLTTPSDSRTAMLQGLLIGVILIAGLYVAREVLLPLALAILLSFVLTPPLLLLRKIKVPRVLAVGIVVAIAFGFILALGWMMSREATELAADLPNYSATLSEKITALRSSTSELKVLKRAGDVLTDLQQQLDKPASAPRRAKRRHAGVAAERHADPGRDQGARAVGLGPLSDHRRHVAAAARHRRHRAAVRHLHPAPARGSARPAHQAVRRLGSAARHLDHDRRSDAAQPLLPEPGADQRHLWHADRRGAVGDRPAEPDRLGHPRRADAFRPLCRRVYRRQRALAHRRRHRSRAGPPSSRCWCCSWSAR